MLESPAPAGESVPGRVDEMLIFFSAASDRDLLGRMRIHGARSKTAFRKVLSERPRESPGKPGQGSVGRSRLLREGDCLAQQGAGFRIGTACPKSLVEITGRCDRETNQTQHS